MPLKGLGNVKAGIVDVYNSANDELRAIYITGLADITKGTPVGNPDLWLYNHPTRGYIDYVGYLGNPEGYVGGRARSNWFLTTELPSITTTTSTKRRPSLKRMPKNVFDKKVLFTNNLPYISKLEYGFHSSQAPEGWVRKALVKMKNKIRNL